MSADKFSQSVGFVVRPPPNHWPADPARDGQHTVGQQTANHVLHLTKWQHMFLCKSANQWPLWMCADFGPKWQGSVSWKCHFRRDLHQASSRVTMSTAWLTDVRRRKCVAISCFALQWGSSLFVQTSTLFMPWSWQQWWWNLDLAGVIGFYRLVANLKRPRSLRKYLLFFFQVSLLCKVFQNVIDSTVLFVELCKRN